MADLLTAIRDELIAQSIVRKPSVAGPLPPMWLEPKLGVPAPGEKPPGGNDTQVGPTAVLGLRRTGGIPRGQYESWARQRTIDVIYRVATAPLADQIDEQIRYVLTDRRDWTMGGLKVIESLVWRELQLISSDEQGFEYVASWIFELYSSSVLYPAP